MSGCDWHEPDDPWAYNKHRYRGEEACDEAKAAWRARQRVVERRLRKEKRELALRKQRREIEGWTPDGR